MQVLQRALRAFEVELVFISQLSQEQREALCQGYVVNRGWVPAAWLYVFSSDYISVGIGLLSARCTECGGI